MFGILRTKQLFDNRDVFVKIGKDKVPLYNVLVFQINTKVKSFLTGQSKRMILDSLSLPISTI